MGCPLCSGNVSPDVSMADAQGRRVIVQGRGQRSLVDAVPGFTPSIGGRLVDLTAGR